MTVPRSNSTNPDTEPLPRVSVVIPVRNSEKTLARCLDSLIKQNYPQDRIDFIVVDAFSTDRTRRIAEQYGAKIVFNPGITGEAGKAVGVHCAEGDLILLVDSDNVLPSREWLRNMVRPILETDVVASEALFYHYNHSEPLIIRYCALIGADDPVSVYLGFYGRFSQLTGAWTDLRPITYDKGQFLYVILDNANVPTMGANGFLARTAQLKKVLRRPYLFDVDLIHDFVESGNDRFARVKVEVLHLFAFGVSDYIRKTCRRARDYYHYERLGMRKYRWRTFQRKRLLSLIFGVLLVYPLLKDAARGYKRLPDVAWFLHWFLCLLSVTIYGLKEIQYRFPLLRS